jgi:hypothetical protein
VNGLKPVVIDEFPFLGKATPALPSLIQRALEPSAQRRNTPMRLLLCGSALSFMEKLLADNAPLRGRAGLELLVPTLDYRQAREFWGIGDLRTAVLAAIAEGTPPAAASPTTWSASPPTSRTRSASCTTPGSSPTRPKRSRRTGRPPGSPSRC